MVGAKRGARRWRGGGGGGECPPPLEVLYNVSRIKEATVIAAVFTPTAMSLSLTQLSRTVEFCEAEPEPYAAQPGPQTLDSHCTTEEGLDHCVRGV